ncbi:unnamed protein product [Soboliphyme baturini]|uniref:Endo/exonuclease/phosphatase domain-containing protein n=1 Tax=Soboliphyme baturini TaxID=241478 RepID=A0A183J6U9_9BILA|nr:unnamed protein product [Soboliphyme baturini]
MVLTPSKIIPSRSSPGCQGRAGCWATEADCKKSAITTCSLSSASRGRDSTTTADEDRRKDDEDTIDEATKYQLDIVGLSSTKRQGCGLLNLHGWKRFYSGVDITTRARASVGVLVCAPNLEREYETFLEEVQCALSEVPNTESFILIGGLNAHVGVDVEKWNGLIGKNGPSDLNSSGMK